MGASAWKVVVISAMTTSVSAECAASCTAFTCTASECEDCRPCTASGRVYTLHAGPKSWSEAKEACEEVGERLPVILSQAQDDAVHAVLSASSQLSAWIGADDLAVEGEWRWVNAQLVQLVGVDGSQYENWGANQPDNNLSDEHCLEMRRVSGIWNDRPCASALAYICENVTNVAPSPPLPPDVPADDLDNKVSVELEVAGSIDDLSAAVLTRIGQAVASLLRIPFHRVEVRVYAGSVRIVVEAGADSNDEAVEFATRLEEELADPSTASELLGVTVISIVVVVAAPPPSAPPAAPPASPPPLPIGGIAGGVVGGVALALGLGAWWRLRYRRRVRGNPTGLWRKHKAIKGLMLVNGRVKSRRAIVGLPGSGGHTKAPESGGLFSGVTSWLSSLATSLTTNETNERFVARSLILGQPEVAAAGLKVALGLSEDLVLGVELSKGVDAVVEEVRAHGAQDDLDNLNYCLFGKAGLADDLPPHVRRSLEQGVYHGGRIAEGDFDCGHEGMTLDDFVNHKHAKIAGLSRVQVLALRLYTTSSFPLFNGPLRAGTCPHPLRMTVYHLAEGLKALRRVEARAAPELFNKVVYLYRGMKDTTIFDQKEFMAKGGTEMAPMSTSAKKVVALSYAQSRCPLLFQYKTRGLGRGVPLAFLSCYPKEEEFLYPPMTYLQPESIVKDDVDNCLVVDVTPQMS